MCMRYGKKIFLLKDNNRVNAVVCLECNFNTLEVSIDETKNCKMYTHFLIFNQNSAILCQKNTKIVNFESICDELHVAFLNRNIQNDYDFICCDLPSIDNFNELIKRAKVNDDFAGKVANEKLYNFNEFVHPNLGNNGMSYFELNKDKLLSLLKSGDEEKILNQKFKCSCWRKICVNGAFYVFGIIYKNNKPIILGVGMPVISKKLVNEKLSKFTTFFPARESVENGFGYYIGFKDLITGKNIEFKA